MPSSQDIDFIKATCGSADYLILRTKLSGEQLGGFYFQDLATRLCPRRKGVGARGIISLARNSEHENSLVTVHVASPHFSPDFLSIDALFCSARFLFDSGVFGLKPIPLSMRGRPFSVESVDSQNFRLEIWAPTNDGRTLDLNEPVVRQSTPDLENAIPLELHQRILAYYRPSSDMQTLSRAVRRGPERQPGRPVVYYTVPQRDLILAAARTGEIVDFASTAALAALAAHLDGFASEEILVTLNGHPFFVQIAFPGPRIWITAPVQFIFSGSFSPEPSASFFS